MTPEFDPVFTYGQLLGWNLSPRTVLVEGTTDSELFALAANLELKNSGIQLFANDLTIVAAGERDRGGATGVIRQLNALRCFTGANLMPNGRPRYRFIGLFDNDDAGRRAIYHARVLDRSIHEYRDMFRLRPIMPSEGNLDPKTLEGTFKRLNKDYLELDWELEDLLPEDFLEAFLDDFPDAVSKKITICGRTHRKFTPDGKARLHRFVKDYATLQDLADVVELIKSLRFYFHLPQVTQK